MKSHRQGENTDKYIYIYIYLIKALYPEHIKNSQNVTRKQATQKKYEQKISTGT